MSDARRLRALEDENGKLKKLLAEAMLERDLVRHWSEDNVERHPEGWRDKKMVAPGVRREAVAQACATHGVSQRRACQALAVDRSSVRYRSIRPDDSDARSAMKAVAGERRRFGYPVARQVMLCITERGASM